MSLPKVSEMESYQSKWLTGLDLQGKNWEMIIKNVTVEMVRHPVTKKQESKYVLHFEGAKKPLVVNKTNVKMLVGAWGEVPENWVNKKVSIEAKRINVGGEMKDSVTLTISGEEDYGGDYEEPAVELDEIQVS